MATPRPTLTLGRSKVKRAAPDGPSPYASLPDVKPAWGSLRVRHHTPVRARVCGTLPPSRGGPVCDWMGCVLLVQWVPVRAAPWRSRPPRFGRDGRFLLSRACAAVAR